MSTRITIRLPSDLKAEAKRIAAAESRSLNSLIEEGLRHLLDDPIEGQPGEDRQAFGSRPFKVVSGGKI